MGNPERAKRRAARAKIKTRHEVDLKLREIELGRPGAGTTPSQAIRQVRQDYFSTRVLEACDQVFAMAFAEGDFAPRRNKKGKIIERAIAVEAQQAALFRVIGYVWGMPAQSLQVSQGGNDHILRALSIVEAEGVAKLLNGQVEPDSASEPAGGQ